MIDPMVSLAFAVFSNKGAYALLLGSGISRASHIPTGWDIVLDLIRKIARVEGADCEPDPAAWFRKAHNAEPDYSKLLDQVAKAPSERQQLLRAYFEPTEEERAQKLKQPTAAHHAIAKLVVAGHIRIIITTNFDRLMERAIEEAGITPTVISTKDQISGAMPRVHSQITIIKLHGDYLDTRIKNTEPELEKYDRPLNTLLDRVLDEYGLIISGWSGDWDIALRAAIERCPTRRFTTFWTTRSALSAKAAALSKHRRAVELQCADADHLFITLHEKVRALEDLAAPHPLSAKMAAATVKRYLVDPSAKIRLHDLVHEETEKLYAESNGSDFTSDSTLPPKDELPKRVHRYEILTETLLSMFLIGGYWGNKDALKPWARSLQRIANRVETGEAEYLLDLRRYPALLLLYGSGLAAIASENYDALATLLTQVTVKEDGDTKVACLHVNPEAVMEKNFGQLLPGQNNKRTPVSSHLFVKLREPLRQFLPRDEDYQKTFALFEYLLGIICADLERYGVGRSGGWHGPAGCFTWRKMHFDAHRLSQKMAAEMETEGVNWGPIKAGLFGGSLEQAKTAKAKFDIFVSERPSW